MIAYYTENVKMPSLSRRFINDWIKLVAKQYGKKIGSLAYVFCDDERILEVNIQYLNHNYYTDVITFDYTEGNQINGDIFISLDTVKSNAEQACESYQQELLRVIIHAVLHLCGIDDKGEGQREIMEAEENKALELIELNQAYK